MIIKLPVTYPLWKRFYRKFKAIFHIKTKEEKEYAEIERIFKIGFNAWIKEIWEKIYKDIKRKRRKEKLKKTLLKIFRINEKPIPGKIVNITTRKSIQ